MNRIFIFLSIYFMYVLIILMCYDHVNTLNVHDISVELNKTSDNEYFVTSIQFYYEQMHRSIVLITFAVLFTLAPISVVNLINECNDNIEDNIILPSSF